MPKVSIITPCFNSSRFIGATVASVLAQDVDDWEYIVVDDGSTDESGRHASEAAGDDERVAVISVPNGGVSAARNIGTSMSDPASEYLVFLDADDLIETDFIRHLVDHLELHRDVGLAYAALREIGENDALIADEAEHAERFVRRGPFIRALSPGDACTPLDALVSRFNAIPSTSMFRRDVYDRTQGWRPSGVVEDKDMGMQMAVLAPVHYVDRFLTRYRQHDDQRHLDSFYDSMHSLHERWWTDEHLDPETRALVRRAIVFDRRVAAMTSRRQSFAHLRRRQVRDAGVEAARSIRHRAHQLRLTARLVTEPFRR